MKSLLVVLIKDAVGYVYGLIDSYQKVHGRMPSREELLNEVEDKIEHIMTGRLR